MSKYTNILYRLARFLTGMPPEVFGAMALVALTHPGIVAIVFASVVLVSKYVVGLIISGIVAHYLRQIFEIYVRPKIPRKLRQLLQKMENRALTKPPDHDRDDTPENQSAYSRNNKRHPHW